MLDRMDRTLDELADGKFTASSPVFGKVGKWHLNGLR